MNDKVVDTNVLAVANGRHETASPSCRTASIKSLKKILENGRIVVDSSGEIIQEYKTYCSPSGQPGVGDVFFREVLLNYVGKILRVDLPRNSDGSFVDFPTDSDLLKFDNSDRKFVAAAAKSGAAIVNATDPDWLEHKTALNKNGIVIEFVCTEQKSKW